MHLSNCYDKLGVENRTQAALKAGRLDAIHVLERRQAVTGNSVRDWLLPYIRVEQHLQGDVLFRKGEPGGALYFLQQGSVYLPEIGKRLREGEMFGEIGIFAPAHTRTSSGRCETDCRLFCLTAEQAHRLYFENPQFAYYILQLIAQRLTEDKNRPSYDGTLTATHGSSHSGSSVSVTDESNTSPVEATGVRQRPGDKDMQPEARRELSPPAPPYSDRGSSALIPVKLGASAPRTVRRGNRSPFDSLPIRRTMKKQ